MQIEITLNFAANMSLEDIVFIAQIFIIALGPMCRSK
jgi:hypothetical protein